MSKPQLTLHHLEFNSDIDFWAGLSASGRCAFLMPITPPSEFLAFGVLEPSKRVHFVARGRVKEDLADFITRMNQSDAGVELYVQAPVPASILRRYTSGPPIEGQESEEPPGPLVRGLVPDPTTPTADSFAGPSWPKSEASSRRVLLMPAYEPAEFLAVGALASSSQVLFNLRGSVREHLAVFVTRMVKDQARVELHPTFPKP
ncbi:MULTISPECIES: hypothetical protein [unclassified Myxococcus]|uniref:hypothetical protein n=1 Tax=unclassified Myxococcus TaxID=2648731 RepID=UPI00157A3A8A|nr:MULTISPECIES: hypothetical protein [unclassified Myxococcus]NTX33993.1 hypothetical protein [Myxococcus sp. CA033]NTX54910.1 hypothetical protein [Myxococcus sp. CA039A]